MKTVFLTAGAAGMFCGSCMHDNALARALRHRGVDCLLQPVYTPIRTDDQSVASKRIFFGGIHIYLLQQMPWLRVVPPRLRHLLDWPPLIRAATRRAHATDPGKLGELTISMLQGEAGNQRDEVRRLVDWLASEIRPDALILTNLLIGGALPAIREKLPHTRIVVLLQGDDIFLDHLPGDARAEAILLCGSLAAHVDRFVVNSRFYADKMGRLLGISADRFDIEPLSIDTAPFPLEWMPRRDPAAGDDGEFRIGYLARVAPEKGLHRLVEAFVDLARRPGNESVSLHVAGWLGEANRRYLDLLVKQIDDAGLSGRFAYHGSPDLAGKVDFLRSVDVLSVPTEYEEPKGLFVLEALAAGVPVVQPDHGGFGELVASTGGGLLVPTGDAAALGEAIQRIKDDRDLAERLGRDGHRCVHGEHTILRAAERMHRLLSGDGASAGQGHTSGGEPAGGAAPQPPSRPRDEASARAR